MLSGEDSTEVSHPPHLTYSGSSAFIPFCAYKNNSNLSGASLVLEGTNFPLCSSFLPTILEGQLCYKLDLNLTSGIGIENELMLMLDLNEDRSLQESSKKNHAVRAHQFSRAKIHINTPHPYIHYGSGTYQMTDVKRMSAKEDFLKMPLKDRNCELELYEDCRTRKLLEECKCVPWEMSNFLVIFF